MRLHGIDPRHRIADDAGDELQGRRQRRAQHARRFADQRPERDRPRLAAPPAAEGEHLLDQVPRPVARLQRLVQMRLQLRIGSGHRTLAASAT